MKKRKFLSDSDISNIIEDILCNMSNNKNNIPLTEYYDEPLCCFDDFINLPKDIKQQILHEGLIATYDTHITYKMLCQKFNLNTQDVYLRNQRGINLIIVTLPTTTNKLLINEITNFMSTCGFFRNNQKIFSKKENKILLFFEPKFTRNIALDIHEHYNYLMHLTPEIYVDKILKNGLIPKSENNIFKYPDRLFFVPGTKLTSKAKQVLDNIRLSYIDKIINSSGIHNPKQKLRHSLLYLKLDEIPSNVKFYIDPIAQDSIFTTDNIPPQAIVKIVDYITHDVIYKK